MPTGFYHTLAKWLPLKNQHQWVLGAVIHTRGSVYRKAGALMLLSDSGHQFGLLSGGCLESDLLLQARKVIALNKSRCVLYDASDEDNLAWRLGIGCGGAADILLHPCNDTNDYLFLEEVFTHLSQGRACHYALTIDEPVAECLPAAKAFERRHPGQLEDGRTRLVTLVNPPPHLLILGSGVDVVSLCELALTLGWRVTLADQRLSPQKQERFPAGVTLTPTGATELAQELLQTIDAAVVAHHNVALDAVAVSALQRSSARYIGLLGPAERRQQVLAAAGLTLEQMSIAVAGPMGLALGGDLPESIALAVLAECHAVIHGSTGKPLSDAYLVGVRTSVLSAASSASRLRQLISSEV